MCAKVDAACKARYTEHRNQPNQSDDDYETDNALHQPQLQAGPVQVVWIAGHIVHLWLLQLYAYRPMAALSTPSRDLVAIMAGSGLKWP